MALPQAMDILNYLQLIFLHVREFHRTLSEVVSSLTADHSFIQSPQERYLEHSATQPLLSVLRIVPHLAYATQTYIRQNHVILNIAQIQHHPTFIGISCSLYISFIQANTQFVSASTMYAMQSNANSCMPSAPLDMRERREESTRDGSWKWSMAPLPLWFCLPAGDGDLQQLSPSEDWQG